MERSSCCKRGRYPDRSGLVYLCLVEICRRLRANVMGALLMALVSRVIWRGTLVCILLVAAHSALADAIDMDKAALVKSAYLKNIAAHTTWPPQKMGDEQRPIVIGVIGEDPNGVISPMRERIETEEGLQAQGRRLQLIELDAPSSDPNGLLAELRGCHLLFLSEDGAEQWALIKPLIDTMPIVTIGEFTSFADQGGMIEYVIDGRAGKVRMIVNTVAVKRAGLVLSARLLGLKRAVIILGEEEDAE
jgi:hypothetical protein